MTGCYAGIHESECAAIDVSDIKFPDERSLTARHAMPTMGTCQPTLRGETRRADMNAINLIEPGSFAEACYNQNSIADMKAALHAPADPVDMETWGLTDDEYYAQINLALAAKREDAE